jgi:geranylgeranyl pyrophosphate synthase
MNRYQQEAFDLLDTFPENEAREAIRNLIIYVADRKK